MDQAQDETEHEKRGRPMTRIRGLGGVSVAIWQNTGATAEGAPTTWYRVTLERAYKPREGAEWAYTRSLRVQDLLPAAYALVEAYRHVASTLSESAVDLDEILPPPRA